MAESALNTRLLKALRPCDPHRVENSVGPGTPDIECTLGWIECKYLDHFPKDKTLAVKCEHFTPQQRVWATKRTLAGGRVFLMLQVGRDYLLFKGDVAAVVLGRVTEDALREAALCTWSKTLVDQELRGVLTYPDEPAKWVEAQ